MERCPAIRCESTGFDFQPRTNSESVIRFVTEHPVIRFSLSVTESDKVRTRFSVTKTCIIPSISDATRVFTGKMCIPVGFSGNPSWLQKSVEQHQVHWPWTRPWLHPASFSRSNSWHTCKNRSRDQWAQSWSMRCVPLVDIGGWLSAQCGTDERVYRGGQTWWEREWEKQTVTDRETAQWKLLNFTLVHSTAHAHICIHTRVWQNLDPEIGFRQILP